MDDGRGCAALSTKKLDLHARPGLNASTVCVFSFEQSAYPKQIAEDRKDAQHAADSRGASGLELQGICN